jgi:anhydro-N-acetylmuramic acid kinase
MRHAGLKPPIAALNLGGVANITWWGGGEDFVAFDTGPANGPINDWAMEHTGKAYDEDGRLADSGTVNEERLAKLLGHPYLSKAFPKSLDRFDLPHTMAEGLSAADGAATLTAFTAAAIAKSLEQLPVRPTHIVLGGGGRHNPALVREIRERTKVEIVMADAVGWRGDAIEAEAFAFLAVRTLRGLPLSYPTTTGVAAPQTGGRIWRAR